MYHLHRAVLKQLIEIQIGLFEGSDFTDEKMLEKNEYFRGQTEMVADVVGGCDAKEAIWDSLKRACAASARGEDTKPHVRNVLEAAESHLQLLRLRGGRGR